MSQFDDTRRVWADLTAHPDATLREIQERTGIHSEGVQLAIHALATAGYITRQPRTAKGRRVLVPFISQFTIREKEPV